VTLCRVGLIGVPFFSLSSAEGVVDELSVSDGRDGFRADWIGAVSAKVWSTILVLVFGSFPACQSILHSLDAGANSQIHFLPIRPYLLTSRFRLITETRTHHNF
jgi:hypothetical protein